MSDATPVQFPAPTSTLVDLNGLVSDPRINSLGLPRSYWYKAARKEGMPCTRIGIKTLFSINKVLEWLTAKAETPHDFAPPRTTRKTKSQGASAQA